MIRSSVIFSASFSSTPSGGVITAVSLILKSFQSTGANKGISRLLAAFKYLFNAVEYIFIFWSSLMVLSLNLLSISKLLVDITYFQLDESVSFPSVFRVQRTLYL